jgi:enoyl-CoA hydratase/carnithine racemase
VKTYKHISVEIDESHVATVTLDRPERMNSFDAEMQLAFPEIWEALRLDDGVHCIVLRAVGDQSFTTGVDFSTTSVRHGIPNVFAQFDPGVHLGPKQNHVWKPLICAVNGMCTGSAFYWINEADIVICSDNATFFDHHVSLGLVAAMQPMGLLHRIPLGEVLRLTLLGLDERMSAERAREIGLVSEVVPGTELWGRAHELAARIAAKPPAAIQGTVKATWQALEIGFMAGQASGLAYSQLGSPLARLNFNPSMFEAGDIPPFEVR